MSFLSPGILWGLLAAAIPLIIHLFSIRRTRTVDFSSIRFIRELEHETIRKLNIRQWLLLFLRTLAIVLIVLMFARPVKVGYFPPWASGGQKTKMVVLLDNSATMSSNFNGESLLDRSKRNLINILKNLEGNVNLSLYQTTPLTCRFSGEFITIQEVENALKLIDHSKGEDNLWETIHMILREIEFSALGSTQELNREFYIFSDFPFGVSSDWSQELNADLIEGNRISDWRFFLFQQPEIQDNIAISSLDIVSKLRLPGRLVKVSTQISNDGVIPRKNVPIQLYFEDERVGQVVSDIEVGKRKDFLFQAFPKHSGFVRGMLELPRDDYELDNQKFFQFSIPPKIRCKMVSKSEEDISLLELALSSLNIDSVFVVYDKITSLSPSTLSLSETDVLFLVDPPQFSKAVIDEIRRFLKRGGDLIAFLGKSYEESTHPSFVDNFYFPKPRGVMILANESYHEVTQIETDHPIFSEFGAKDLYGEMPQVFSHVELDPNDSSKVLLSLANGDPLLLEVKHGGANALIFSSLPDLTWMDLPIRGIFVPLLHRMIVYLATDDELDRSVIVGESVTIPLNRKTLSSEIEMRKPSGRRSLLVPDYQKEAIKINAIDESGVYDLLADGKKFFSFVANISQSENPLLRLTQKKLRSHFPKGRTKIVFWDDDPVVSVTEARRGTELWQPFLIAALIVLALETWIGRVRKEKFKE